MDKKDNHEGVWANLKKTWPFTKGSRKFLVLAAICGFIGALVNILLPIINAQVLISLTSGNWDLLLKITILAAFVIIFDAFRNYAARRFYQVVGRRSTTKVQQTMVREIIALRITEIDKRNSGLFIDRATKDARTLGYIYNQIMGEVFQILSSIGVLIAVFIISKWLAFYLIITIVILYFFEKYRVNQQTKMNKQWLQTAEAFTGIFTELIRGLRDVKILNLNRSLVPKMDNDLEKLGSEQLKESNKKAYYDLNVKVIKAIFMVIFIVLGIYLNNLGLLTITGFLIIFQYRNTADGITDAIAYLIEYLKSFALASSRVFEVMEHDKMAKEEFGNHELKNIKGDIEFKSVSFTYELDKNKVLNNVSFKVNHDRTIAIVGESGAGKSTILSLLARLYDPCSGVITLDGVNMKELSVDSIKENIAVINQMPYVFNLSIRDNLFMVKESATEQEVIKACKLACLHEFIETLPEGYDTVIGEGGVILSGGQRQRLAIARALLKNSKVIVLDEATSALDNQTQSEIKEAIDSLKHNYTVIIVAHRLSTIKHCDKIIVLDKGKVVGEGMHKELLLNNKYYQKLYKQK